MENEIIILDENDYLRSKFLTANISSMSRTFPYAFTEQGIYMLMTVLKGELATKQSKTLIRLFKQMKDFILTNSQLFAEIDSIKKHLIESDLHHKENDKRIDELFTLMDKYKIEEKQGIFFQGQIFDAYAKFESFIQSAKKEIISVLYHIGASLKDLAKKCFAFEILDSSLISSVLGNL